MKKGILFLSALFTLTMLAACTLSPTSNYTSSDSSSISTSSSTNDNSLTKSEAVILFNEAISNTGNLTTFTLNTYGKGKGIGYSETCSGGSCKYVYEDGEINQSIRMNYDEQLFQLEMNLLTTSRSENTRVTYIDGWKYMETAETPYKQEINFEDCLESYSNLIPLGNYLDVLPYFATSFEDVMTFNKAYLDEGNLTIEATFQSDTLDGIWEDYTIKISNGYLTNISFRYCKTLTEDESVPEIDYIASIDFSEQPIFDFSYLEEIDFQIDDDRPIVRDEVNPVSLANFNNRFTESNPLTIRFWTGFGINMTDILQSCIDDFEKLYPNIKIKLESKGGYDNLFKSISLSVTDNLYPDMAMGYSEHFANYISQDIQAALDPFIESKDYGMDLSIFNPDYMAENQNLLYKDEEKEQPYTMGLPFAKSTEVMVYNKTFFDWVKTLDASIEVPQTWQQADEVSAKILTIMEKYYGKVVKDNDGETLLDFTNIGSSDFHPLSYDSTANMFITSILQWGGKYTEMSDTYGEGHIKFDNQQTREAMNFFQGMFNEGKIGIPSSWNEASYCSNPFKAIKSVMTISSTTGVANNIPSGAKFDIGIASIPYNGSVEDNTLNSQGERYNRTVMLQGVNLGMFKHDDYRATASWLLMKYLTEGEGNVDFAINSGFLPVVTEKSGIGEQSSKYQEFLNTVNGTDADLARVNIGKVVKYEYNGGNDNNRRWNKYAEPSFRGSGTIRDSIGYIYNILFYGLNGNRYTIDSVIAWAYDRLAAYVKEEVA